MTLLMNIMARVMMVSLSDDEVIAVIVIVSSMVMMRLMRMMMIIIMSMSGSFGEWSLNQFNVQSFV